MRFFPYFGSLIREWRRNRTRNLNFKKVTVGPRHLAFAPACLSVCLFQTITGPRSASVVSFHCCAQMRFFITFPVTAFQYFDLRMAATDTCRIHVLQRLFCFHLQTKHTMITAPFIAALLICVSFPFAFYRGLQSAQLAFVSLAVTLNTHQ